MTMRVTKTYGHECGFSCTFRQWRADSHCRFVHGYALSFKLVFRCENGQLDKNGWVINFGGLKPIKKWLEEMFDHTYLVARDDPALKTFRELDNTRAEHRLLGHEHEEHGQLIQLREVDATGCEGFAIMVGEYIHEQLRTGVLFEAGTRGVKIESVEVREHAGNSAIYTLQHS